MTKVKGGAAGESGPVEVPEVLSILPLRNSVLFPGSIIPIDVGRRKSVRLVEEAISKEEPFITARVQAVPDPTTTDVELDALVMNLRDIFKRVVKLMPEMPKEAGALVESVTEPGQLADLVTSNIDIQVDE